LRWIIGLITEELILHKNSLPFDGTYVNLEAAQKQVQL
jgi:hypothetical protein